jgi:hypothetical protein
MFGFEPQDSINNWLKGAKEGRPMLIDSQQVKNEIWTEIRRIEVAAKQRVDELKALLANPKYFKQ